MGGWPSGWICVLDARSWTLQAGGKLTRALVATAAKVVAVEPVAGMRERLAAALTGVELLDGVAEAIPLDDASVDAATVG
jgi:ubiquinone/menaquinone biosynthesis C-methylase UbiE